MSAVYLSSGVASEITPVPGGVGPVTNVALMRNVVSAARDAMPDGDSVKTETIVT